MLDILHVAPGLSAKKQAAKALGRMGYIMAQEGDFSRYQDWLFSKFHMENDEICSLFMTAFKETLALDSNKPVLQEHAEHLMADVLAAMESIDNREVFKPSLDILMTLAELYPEEFYGQFRDTVDLLIGWHIDDQPLSMIEYISNNLLRISKHFQINLDFSITLILNFFEDIETYLKQLHNKPNDATESISIEYLTALILALNTVLKCLGESFHPQNTEAVTMKFVTDCLTQIIKAVMDTLENYLADNLTIAGNDAICLLLSVPGTKSVALSNAVYSLIDMELVLLQEFSESAVVSVLLMVSKTINELSANLPLQLVTKLVGAQSEVHKLKYSPCKNVSEATIHLYQSLLNLKNIPLLQEAYRCLIEDLDMVFQQIIPKFTPLCENNAFVIYANEIEDPEYSALFLLRCLSRLANSSGSIIGLWALKPSILELLGVFLKPHNEILGKHAPSLQYSLFYLIFSHSKCYNHYIASSSLVTNQQEPTNLMARLVISEGLNIGDVANRSPNSGHFTIILDILYKTLSVTSSSELTLLLLEWLKDVLLYAEPYLLTLYGTEEFTKVSTNLVFLLLYK